MSAYLKYLTNGARLAIIRVIDIDHTTVVAMLEAMISEWLHSGKATWENLINALEKTGVLLPQPQVHGIPQQPSHSEIPGSNVWKNIWETKINDLHKAHKAYKSRRLMVQNMWNTSILDIRVILGIPNDIYFR